MLPDKRHITAPGAVAAAAIHSNGSLVASASLVLLEGLIVVDLLIAADAAVLGIAFQGLQALLEELGQHLGLRLREHVVLHR